MKTNAIIRIVIFSLVILVLTSILVGGIALRGRGFGWAYRLHQGAEEVSPPIRRFRGAPYRGGTP